MDPRPEVGSYRRSAPRSAGGLLAKLGPPWYRQLCLAALLTVLLSGAWLNWSFGGPAVTQTFANVHLVVVAGVSTAALVTVTRASESSHRFGWALITVGVGLFGLGEVAWTVYDLGAASVPYPGPADLFYLAGYPFLAVGLLVVGTRERNRGSVARLGLDGLLVGLALFAVSYHIVLEPILAESAVDQLTAWVTLAYPTFDIVLASVAFVVAVNTRGARRVPLLLMGAGVFVWVFADSMFAYLAFSGGYVFTGFDAAWTAGYLAIGLAAVHPAASERNVVPLRRRYDFWELIGPYGPFLVAMTTLGYVSLADGLDAVGLTLGALVLFVLVARQSYVFHDASELSREIDRNEQILERRNDELVLLNRIVRHDIRNDMAVVLGWGEELENHVDEDGEPMLDRMLNTTQHTVELTETLRDFTEAIEEDGQTDLEPISLDTILSDVLERRRRTYTEAAFEVPTDLPDVDVRATPLLSSVFRNLLNNAVQHNDAADPVVTVTAESDGEVATVRIADNGPGIPEERRETLFGRGEKGLDSSGSGVGLYLVDTLVTQFGGDVWIETSEAGGAAFVVELRCA